MGTNHDVDVDEDANAARVWHVIGSSVQGVSHLRTNTPCQDEFCFRVDRDWVVIAIADGASSAERSKEGAHLATYSAIDYLSSRLAEQLPQDIPTGLDLMSDTYRNVRDAIKAFAEKEGVALESFATTLSCVLATDERLVVGQVGDGLIVASEDSGELFSALLPERGEYANETSFITTADALARTQIRVYNERVSRLAATSDGLLRLAVTLPDYCPFPAFFEPLFAFARSSQTAEEQQQTLQAFLMSDRVHARTDDDKTLVLAVR